MMLNMYLKMYLIIHYLLNIPRTPYIQHSRACSAIHYASITSCFGTVLLIATTLAA